MTKKDIQSRLGVIAADVETMADDDEHLDEMEALLAEAEQLQEELQVLEAQEKRRAQAKARMTSLQQFRQSSPGPMSQRQNGVVASVNVASPEWMNDPAYGYASPRAFLLDVIQAETRGIVSEQLQYLRYEAVAGSDEASGAADPFGGFLVPTAFMPQLLSVGFEGDPIAGRTLNVPMTAPSVQIPARVDKNHTSSVTGGLRVFRRAETDTSASSRMEMELITLRANPLMGISFASEELLTDSAISFAAIVSAGFRDEFSAKILDERIRGTGVGQYLGVLNSPALISATRSGANLIAYTDIFAIRARVWGYQNAVWLANHDTIPQLSTAELSAGSGSVWQPSLREDMPDMLLGRPLFFTEYASSLGSVGDLICANFTQYLEGTLQGMRGDESVHVRFLNNERTFRFTARNDGQPWWRAALTPNQSSTTLSPFVTLAA